MSKPGGGFKINLLREAIEPFKDQDNTIIMFTDSYDVIFTSGPNTVLQKFKESGSKILFSAEKFCWPDTDLASSYPNVSLKASKYLNSGGFMGYARYIYKMLNAPIDNKDDDQLYFTKIFLNEKMRESLEIQLDTESKIFQNLHGAENDVTLTVDPKSYDGVLKNLHFLTTPSVIHGNGLSKIELNAFGNYLAGTFNEKCLICEEGRIALEESKLPVVTIGLMVTKLVPFYEEFLNKIAALNYPKNQIHLFIHSMFEFHDAASKSFVSSLEKLYRSAKLVLSTDDLDERKGRQLLLQQVSQKKSDYLFSIDADAHIDDIELLRELLTYNRSFIAPVIRKNNDMWSNFWGALSDSGYYARSHDYLNILYRNIIGMWNVPYVSSCYLIKSLVLQKINFDHKDFDADMAMCDSLREAGVFMYVINDREYGHLVNTTNFDTTVARPDFYTLLTNQIDWEHKYIHSKYLDQFNPNVTQNQPCPDVYWFQIVTDKFCEDLVAIMENFGKWSDGRNNDERLEGGYEAVPTRDIHMKQVGLEPLWLKFLQLYVRPLVEKVFTGYYSNPPKSIMNFVVRYRPDEQPYLRPHHDASTYTINIALNRASIDYEGGGCNFLRYNCSIIATKMGWMLMHPGRLTHFHEGLKVTKGTRYIMISFVDP